jgi:dienelactone hydrolase
MKTIRWLFQLSAVLLSLSHSTLAQSVDDPLPRRAYFGVGLEKAEGGARVYSVAHDSTAEALGVVIGDIIEAVDTQSTTSPDSVVSAIGHHRGGETVQIDVRRAGNLRRIGGTLKTIPLEQMANATVHYGSVAVQPDVRLRTILSIPMGPPNSRFPAVMLIQGGGCGSIDSPFSTDVAQPGLIHRIGSQGFITMRVEKSGVGDSQGAPCDTIGYKEELAGYQAALAALRSNPAVNQDRIYLLGISLGGVFAPLLAAETKVAGISVWGTSSVPPPVYPGRSERFFREFASVDVAAAWLKANTRVQVMQGEYDNDPYTNRGREIIAPLNKLNPGSATFTVLAGLDHCWTRHVSLEASVDKCGQGEPSTALIDSILSFLRSGKAEA